MHILRYWQIPCSYLIGFMGQAYLCLTELQYTRAIDVYIIRRTLSLRLSVHPSVRLSVRHTLQIGKIYIRKCESNGVKYFIELRVYTKYKVKIIW